MAALTTIALATAAVASTGIQVAGAISANKRAKKAEKAIENFERQELVNYAALTVSPIKEEEIRLEQLAKTSATQTAMVEKLGSRGIGAAAAISERTDLETQRITASIEAKQAEDKIRAMQGAMHIQDIQEGRESEELAGLGSMYNVARQEKAQYITGAAGSLMDIASIGAQMKSGTGATKASPATGEIKSATVSDLASQYMGERPSYEDYYTSEAQGFSYDTLLEDVLNEDPYYKFNRK